MHTTILLIIVRPTKQPSAVISTNLKRKKLNTANTDSVENSTSAGQEGPLDGDKTLVDGSNNSQDDAYNAEELTKPNKYPKRTVHDQIKKRLGKEVPLFIKP